MAEGTKCLFSVKEVAELLPISESTIYSEINKGNIPTMQFGRRKFVPKWYVDKVIKNSCEGS